MTKLTDILISLPAFIIGISILVAVHEFGHFWVARRLGIKTLRFSIGFGRVLWSRFGRDGTEYAISALPLGGYVRMADERDGSVAAIDLPQAFNRQPVWKRVAVLFAGPGFNFLFAILAYWILLVAGVPGVKPVVGEVTEHSIAASAGLRKDDVILAVDGKPTNTQEVFAERLLGNLIDGGVVSLRVAGSDGSTRELQLNAINHTRELTEPGALFVGLGFDFWSPPIPSVVATVEAGGPAAAGGLIAGDKIVSLDGVAVADFSALTKLIETRARQNVTIDVLRHREPLSLQMTIGEKMRNGQAVGRLGIGSLPRPALPQSMRSLQRESIFAALPLAVAKTWDKIAFIFNVMWHLISGDVSLKSISGPVGIAAVTGMAVQIGVLASIEVLALISISLGALNLLPVPILDGGQIVYQLAELLKGGPVSERAQLLGQQVGIVLLILLMGLALFNDLAPHSS
jgi:regulator of sigma E protease